MSAFSAWALSIVGIVMLGMLVDTVMPEGQTAKYIKSVFAVMTVLVIAAPLPALLSGGMDFEDIFGSEGAYQVDEKFIESLNRQKVEALTSAAQTAFTAAGYTDVEVSVTHETKENVLVIVRIFVDTSSAAYKGEQLNTNSKEGIKDILCNIFGVNKEVISLYG